MNVWQFMSDSPILTFFLAVAICEMVSVAFKALGGKYRCRDCKTRISEETR